MDHFLKTRKIDLSNYATKADLKIATGIGTSESKIKFSQFKSWSRKIDAEKLKGVPVDLSKLSNVIIMMLLKKLSMIN